MKSFRENINKKWETLPKFDFTADCGKSKSKWADSNKEEVQEEEEAPENFWLKAHESK